jgi:hypothetical protein
VIAVDDLGVGIDEQLVGVVAVAGLVYVGAKAHHRAGVEVLVVLPVGTPGDVAVVLAFAYALDVEVPDIVIARERELLGGPVALGVVEEQQLDPLGVGRVDREVDALVDERGAQVLERADGVPVQRVRLLLDEVQARVVARRTGRKNAQRQHRW